MMGRLPGTTTLVQPRWYRLENPVQPYAWGCRGADALIPRLLGIEPPAEQASAKQPFAELWMGAHPNAPSRVLVDGRAIPLPEWVAAAPEAVLGAEVARDFAATFPFLFKVLSAAEVLSIQAHPNREQAQRLHAQSPELYPDANPKPELAVALGDFWALVGFRPLIELQAMLREYPPLCTFIGAEAVAPLLAAQTPSRAAAAALVRAAITALVRGAMTRPAALAETVAALARCMAVAETPIAIERLFARARAQYGDADVGLLLIFFLNLVRLERGEALFLPAGVPHAYVSGDIVECMANSDNVVRAGLTPKFKDTETLLEILDYRPGLPPVLHPQGAVYPTPTAEFRLSRWVLRAGQSPVTLAGGRVQILLALEGEVCGRWPGGELSLTRGQAALAPGCLRQFEIGARADAVLFQVEAPPPD